MQLPGYARCLLKLLTTMYVFSVRIFPDLSPRWRRRSLLTIWLTKINYLFPREYPRGKIVRQTIAAYLTSQRMPPEKLSGWLLQKVLDPQALRSPKSIHGRNFLRSLVAVRHPKLESI